MSTRREHEPAIPDRLPGEEDIAQLYQQAEPGADEQPSAALDAVILAEAQRATRPRLRLIQGRRLSQMTRRWALPLSLAAALIVTIGVVTNLREDIGRPLMKGQSEKAPAVSTSAREMQSAQAERQDEPKAVQQEAQKEWQKNAPQKTELRATSPLADDAFDLKDEAARPQQKQKRDAPPPSLSARARAVQPTSEPVPSARQAPAPMTPEFKGKKKKQSAATPLYREKRRRNERNVTLLEKSMEETDSALVAPMSPHDGLPQEEAESLSSDARTGQRIRGADISPEITTRSPKDWLADIDQLFETGKRREAEDSLRAFQKQYPDYTDYPESFPQDVLDRLQNR
jgi:hypothetical protein